MSTPTAIVIGSGVAGLAVAIRLAVQGFSVEVFEKNDYPGGKLSAIDNNGFSFDAGPSLFTQPTNIEALFTLANEPIQSYFQYEKLPIVCKYFYADGNIVNAYSDATKFAGELESVLGEHADSVLEYLKNAERLYNKIGTLFLDESLHKKNWFSRPVANAFASVRAAYLFKSLHQYNQQKFSHPGVIQLFDRFATYNGSNPYKAPGMLSLIPHLEHNEGAYYPRGGMISITNALHKLAVKLGVQFHFNKPVKQIIEQNGYAKGVIVRDEKIYSDIVVSNCDVYFTYRDLLKKTRKAKSLLKQERSSSALIFYWGIKKQFPQLQLHNIFFSKDYANEFNHIFNKATIAEDVTVYVNITAKMEAGFAPAGMENWFVMVNVPANTGQDWQALKQKARNIILKKLSAILKEDIAPLIVTEATLDPLKIEADTMSYMGSLYGTSSNSKMAAFVRHPNFAPGIKGLYFAGGSVHPGGGIPLCLKSAAIVSDLVMADYKKIMHTH